MNEKLKKLYEKIAEFLAGKEAGGATGGATAGAEIPPASPAVPAAPAPASAAPAAPAPRYELTPEEQLLMDVQRRQAEFLRSQPQPPAAPEGFFGPRRRHF